MKGTFSNRCSRRRIPSSYTWLRMIIGIFLVANCLFIYSLNSASPIDSSLLARWESSSEDLHQTRSSQKRLCNYSIVVLVTPDSSHCQGASVLYGSILRTVIAEKLPHRSVCVNFMYINASISLETMHRWEERVNPYANLVECRELMNEQMKEIVPISWYPIRKLFLPRWATPKLRRWSITINKIHLLAFDRFERFFLLDVDILALREVTKIFDETPLTYDIAGGTDGWRDCSDRSRINAGALLIKGSRDLHSAALQMLDDRNASCQSNQWSFAEQELLNCLCGFLGKRPQRPEFKCLLLPIYNHVYPRGYKCPDARVRPLRLIHFAGDNKPWEIQTNQTKERDRLFWWCLKDAMSKTIDDMMHCEPFSL